MADPGAEPASRRAGTVDGRLRAPDRRQARELVRSGVTALIADRSWRPRDLVRLEAPEAASVPRLGWRKRALAWPLADRPRPGARRTGTAVGDLPRPHPRHPRRPAPADPHPAAAARRDRPGHVRR